jgi:hypothetical protein
MIKIVMDESMTKYDEDDDKMVIAQLNSDMMETLKIMGPALVANYMEPLSGHIMHLLEKKATCQTEYDAEEDGTEDEDQAEYDALVIR